MPLFLMFFFALAEKPLLSQFFSKKGIHCQNRRTLEQNARNPHGYSVFLFYSQTLRSTMFQEKQNKTSKLSFKKTVDDATPFLALSVLRTVGDAMNSTHAWDAN